jgi:antitoxin VapB
MTRTKTFKSGNSVAVRLPKTLGIAPGVDMIVREEKGRYVLEPVRRLIDVSKFAGKCPGLKPLPRVDFDDPPRDWHLFGRGVPDE